VTFERHGNTNIGIHGDTSRGLAST
jgi:hypothetical protein